MKHIITRQHANARELKRYFTGKPCKHGHLSEKSTINGRCCECAKGYDASHKLQRSKKDAKRRKCPLYKKRISDQTKLRKKSNPDLTKNQYGCSNTKHKEYIKKWHTDNRESVLANSQRYRSSHPETASMAATKRRAYKLDAIPRWTKDDDIVTVYKLREEMILATSAAGYRIDYQVDHYYPLINPTVCGLHCVDNLQIISADENRKKSNKLPEVFYGEFYE